MPVWRERPFKRYRVVEQAAIPLVLAVELRHLADFLTASFTVSE
jgi:hypothetical protein